MRVGSCAASCLREQQQLMMCGVIIDGAHVFTFGILRGRPSELVRGMQCQRGAATDHGVFCEACGDGEHVEGGRGSHGASVVGRGRGSG